jgi:hypothetical protein
MALTLAVVWAGCTGEIGAAAEHGSPASTSLGSTESSSSGVSTGSAGTGSAPDLQGDKPGSTATGADCSDALAWDVGATPLRRLTQDEYGRTMQQLFQLAEKPDVSAVPAEAAKGGFTVYAEHQTMSAQHMRGYLAVASRLAEGLLADAKRQASVVGCELSAEKCLPEFVARFGRLAYRRPLSAAEVNSVVTAARTDSGDASEPYLFAIEALLVSPSFLYRSELGAGDKPESVQRLTDYEVAARLSFALLGRGPSAALLDRAEAGALQTGEGQRGVADMLAEEAGYPELYRSFFEQWLRFDKLITPKEPPADWDDALLIDMRAETSSVLERYAFGGGSFFDVLRSDETLVSAGLATFYGLPSPGDSGAVHIPSDHPRAGAGLLGHASLLSKKSDGDAIAQRGNWLRSTFLCQHLEIPAAVAATLGERLVGLTHTEIVRERNSDGACRGCHAVIDPIGVGLDAFDATGRFDPDYQVPDYGITPALPDSPDPEFKSVAELSKKLEALPQVASCLTARTFLFTHGREPDARDRCAIEQAQRDFQTSGYDFRALVESLVSSPAFVLRRAPASAPSAPSAPSAQGAAP